MKKLQSQPSALDDYISGSPEPVRGVLQQVRTTIRKAAPEAAETIKYGIPTFVLGENLVHFAAFKKHIGFYPTPPAIAAFREQLSVYKSAKGSVQFPLASPMPLKLIDEALSGEWNGHRSSRLGQQYCVIYRVERDSILIEVVSITAHDYRRK